MAAKRDEKESESEEEEGQEEEEGAEEERGEEVEKKKRTTKKKISAEKNVTYFGGIKLSDARRTTLAYVSVLLSLTGLVLGVVLVVSGYQEDSYLSDFSDLVKGYSGGGIFTIMMVIGLAAGVIQLLGCHVCFRATVSIERKKLYYLIWVYMMALLCLLIFFVVACLAALIYWLSASSAFQVLYEIHANIYANVIT